MLLITKSVETSPKPEFILKAALIVLAVSSVVPTMLNCPNRFISTGNFLPKTLGNKTARLS